MAFAYAVASAYPSYTGNPTVTQSGWTALAAFRENTWGGMCVAFKS